MRPINNIVDITNYVMLEYGTPQHAFDYDKLDNYLCVRYAKEGESIVTIDEVERKLTPNQSVVIATKEKPVCIGGVFGGLNSEIDSNSKNIALEAAYFTPHTNRKSARSVGYRSEASSRYEKGIDIEMVTLGLYRSIQLLQKYANAQLTFIRQPVELPFSVFPRKTAVRIHALDKCEILFDLRLKRLILIVFRIHQKKCRLKHLLPLFKCLRFMHQS